MTAVEWSGWFGEYRYPPSSIVHRPARRCKPNPRPRQARLAAKTSHQPGASGAPDLGIPGMTVAGGWATTGATLGIPGTTARLGIPAMTAPPSGMAGVD